MLRLCGIQSKTPYYVEAIDTNVYSLEEINYFLYNHINLVYREFFCEELFSYIENELGRSSLAVALRQMDKDGAGIQELVIYVLKNSGYYSAEELSNISGAVLKIDNMSRIERLTIEADSLFGQGRYEAALHIYLDVLRYRKTDGGDDHFYARVAYSIGKIYARLFMSRNANTYFSYAYELDQDAVYARACVYMSIINEDDEELLHTIQKYKVSDEALSAIRRKVEYLKDIIRKEDETREFAAGLKNDEQCTGAVDHWKNEYYRMLS